MMDTVNDNILEKERLWNKQLFDETDREENNHCENGKVIHCKNEGIFASDNDTDLATLAPKNQFTTNHNPTTSSHCYQASKAS
jgi:hypothetical protein